MDVLVLPGCAALQSFRQLTAQTVYRKDNTQHALAYSV